VTLKNIVLTEEEKTRMMSGEGVIIERSGSKTFVPAVDESVYKTGGAGAKHIK